MIDKFFLLWYNDITKGREVIIMTEKNRKKQEAKKYRNVWGMNPRTRKQANGKAYSRQKVKKEEKNYK